MIIEEIYKVNYMKDKFTYIGTLRNEKLFNINDNIFFAYNYHDIVKGKIVGVEILPDENPEYKYKIRIPEEIIKSICSHLDSLNGDLYARTLRNIEVNCNYIFNTTEEAKKSAIKNLHHMYKLQAEEIERYFEQFGLPNNLKQDE